MTITIWTAHGHTTQPPAEIIAKAASLKPAWLWIEPRPGCGLDVNAKPIPELSPPKLHPLLQPCDPMPTLDPALIVDEARLFWSDAALHLLADSKTRTRCVFWGHGEAPSESQARLVSSLGLSEPEARPVEACEEETVLTRCDLQRFGLSVDPRLPPELRIRTYRADSRFNAWTITRKEGH